MEVSYHTKISKNNKKFWRYYTVADSSWAIPELTYLFQWHNRATFPRAPPSRDVDELNENQKAVVTEESKYKY